MGIGCTGRQICISEKPEQSHTEIVKGYADMGIYNKRRERKNIERRKKKKGRLPVISVRDVSMYFKVPEESASSLKEFTVQLAAGRRRYRTLKALIISVLMCMRGK